MFLFCSIPQWFPASAYLAPALLCGQLKDNGFDAKCHDFNIRFFNDILTSANVCQSYERSKKIAEGKEQFYANCTSELISAKFKSQMNMRKKICQEFLVRYDETSVMEIIDNVEWAVRVFKTESFYNPEDMQKALDVLKSALYIISLPYAPDEIRLDNYISDRVFNYDFAEIDFRAKNSAVNMFLSYFEKIVAETDFSGVEMIGLSVTDLSQIVPAFTLGRLLKKHTDAKICFGGNYIFKIADSIKNLPMIFDEYCDYFAVGDGELSTVELAQFIKGKRKIEDVHSLIYKNQNDEICTNETAPLLNLEKVSYPDFDGYDFSLYFSPETVIPVQLGKGCYWGKCTFCDFYTGQQKFDIKSVLRAVDEVEYLSKKYNTPHFNFVDEAVPPAFYNRFATEVKKRGLKINFYSFARLEKQFTEEVLQNLFEAGGKFFMWGYEAASHRVMKLMNKGVDLSCRERILSDSVKVGLWNIVTFLLCYPTETTEELQQTIDMIYNNEIIDTCVPSNFALKKNAILKNNTEGTHITDFTENGQLHISYKYNSDITTMEEVKRLRNNFEQKFLIDNADKLFAHSFTESDFVLLYLSRYGRDYVKNYRLKYKKKL